MERRSKMLESLFQSSFARLWQTLRSETVDTVNNLSSMGGAVVYSLRASDAARLQLQ